ncbi:MAG: sulfite exporter TauE/SafE family protein [Alphaproteobacteria bacterium]|nr:sulfite exporter TauE/SafE family protein [Alphaproteobacteria bacterium]
MSVAAPAADRIPGGNGLFYFDQISVLLNDAGRLLLEPQTWFLAAVVLVAGVVRGFSGFGGALIFIPLAAAILGPKKAVAVFYLFDLLSATPYGYAYIPKCNKREVAPMIIAAWALIPVGAWILGNTDPYILRWILCAIVLLMLAILATGWRYKGQPTMPASIAIGATAGLSGGATGVSGPVVIAYWLSSTSPAAVIRANIMVFYALVSTMTDIIFFFKGFFTFDVAVYALIAWPVYSAGLYAGARFFKGASDTLYRNVAYGLIAASVLISLPLFDRFIR